ncbi:MAG: hypothetical protein KGD57_02265 [Candidatus Lokiarchaeota archaeon]|nr:hypothetical protein [Candidatus Lokiarchaeota archaeon]
MVVIGDNSHDIESALNVSAKSIAINSEKSDFFKKDKFQYADLIIEQNNIPNDLIKAIKTFL